MDSNSISKVSNIISEDINFSLKEKRINLDEVVFAIDKIKEILKEEKVRQNHAQKQLLSMDNEILYIDEYLTSINENISKLAIFLTILLRKKRVIELNVNKDSELSFFNLNQNKS